jgi:hypothetical protein
MTNYHLGIASCFSWNLKQIDDVHARRALAFTSTPPLACTCSPMRAAALLFASGVLLAAVPAGAEPPPKIAVRLVYTIAPGIPGCPAEKNLTAYIGSYFGYQPVQPDARAVLTVAVRPKGNRLVADLSLRNPEGEITWHEPLEEGEGCSDLIENAALLIRLRLGPLSWGSRPVPPWLAAEPAPPPPAPAPDPPPAPPLPAVALLASPAPAKPAPAPALPTPEVPSWLPRTEFSAAFVVAPWATPKLALGGGAGIAARWPFALVGFEFRGLGGLYPTTTANISTQPHLWLVTASACLARRPFLLCGLGAFGRYAGAVEGPTQVTQDERQSALRGWLGLRAAADWQLLDRFALRFMLDGMVLTGGETWDAVLGTRGQRVVFWKTPDFFAAAGIAGVVRFQ